MKTISYIILTLGSLLGILGLVKSSQAATINAASCSQAEVQAAIDAARDGDTVTVPAGVCSWGIAALSIPDGKNIILQGAGKDVTTINGTYNYTLLEVNATSSRITGFTFTEGTIDVHGQGFRIDHCKLTSAAVGGIAAAMVTAVSWSNDVTCYGLIDHCETHNARLVHAGGPSLFANYRWAEPNNLGDQNALYVEDCTVDGSVMTINSTDQNYGGAIVFRYNSIDNSQNQVHSLQAGDTRGSKRWEFYGNTYTAEVDSQYHWVAQFIRGGTGVSFNNKWSGSYNDGNILLDNVRSENVDWSKDDCGRCDGSSLWDGNTPVQDYATLDVIGLGAHKGSNNAPILTDSSKSWIVNDFVGCWIYNLADGSKGKITTNTATTVNATLSGGSRNNWNINDNYKLSCGYPCRDALGQGQDEFLWVTPNVPPIPAQSKQPAYIWGNWNGTTFSLRI